MTTALHCVVCVSACNFDPRIASFWNVTLTAPLQRSIRCRLLGRRQVAFQACSVGGAVGRGRSVAERLPGDQLLGRLPPKRPQETLHDRMLFRPELLGVFLAQPADNRERS